MALALNKETKPNFSINDIPIMKKVDTTFEYLKDLRVMLLLLLSWLTIQALMSITQIQRQCFTQKMK